MPPYLSVFCTRYIKANGIKCNLTELINKAEGLSWYIGLIVSAAKEKYFMDI